MDKNLSDRKPDSNSATANHSRLKIMKTGISFIIPCFNCSGTIDESVNSILQTNYCDEDEIILVDDASTDDTYTKLLSLQSAHRNVFVYKHHINKGSAAAGRNTGIDHSANDLIFCLDADNVLKPNTIAPLKVFLLQNNLDAAAFGNIDYFEGAVTNITEQWVLVEVLNFIDALNDPMKTPCGAGNFLYTKMIWKKAGRYNESLGGAYDSEIFGLKLLAEGAKFRTLEGTGYFHRQGYESTFIREYDKRNSSLLFLSGLIEHLSLVHEDDVEYMFGKGRLNWKDNIAQRPIRPRNTQPAGLLKKVFGKFK